MKTIGILLAVMIVAGVSAAAAIPVGDDASAGEEGLAKVKVKGLDAVYAQPGADLSGYTKIMLDPVEVAFSKNWRPDIPGGEVTAEDRQKIREGVARVLRERLAKALESSSRYALVDLPGPHVLRIKADIRDLYITAPDIPTTGITRNYAFSAGEMTLVAELRDAPSGALIARVIDRKKDPDTTWIRWTTRVSNTAAAERAVDDWVRILLRQLDAAHSVGTTS